MSWFFFISSEPIPLRILVMSKLLLSVEIREVDVRCGEAISFINVNNKWKNSSRKQQLNQTKNYCPLTTKQTDPWLKTFSILKH